jgi:hypothetical protein
MSKQEIGLSDEDGEEISLEEIEERLKRNAMHLDAFGASLSKTLSRDIDHRLTSGVEDRWIEDEEFYDGVDDANRAEEHIRSFRKKPEDIRSGSSLDEKRSKIFPNITGPFVDAASSRIADVLLPPSSEPSWSLAATPISDLVEMVADGEKGLPKMDKAQKEEFFAEVQKLAEESARKAQKRIHDWHIQCNRRGEIRKSIEDAAKIGVGIIRAPYAKVTRKTGYFRKKVVRHVKTSPATKRVDPWNFFPDKECGEDIHTGGHCWERDYLSGKKLQDLMDDDTYLKDQILLCLKEGPLRATRSLEKPFEEAEKTSKFEVWYYHGTAEREDLEAAGMSFNADETRVYIPSMITVVNGRVIRVSLDPLGTGELPYSTFVWRKRSGSWAGIGVARQIRVAQKIVTGAARNIMENAGIGAGPMLIFKKGSVVPANGIAELAPRKVWLIGEDADSIQRAEDAIGIIKVDMCVNELMVIVEFGLRLAESTTGLPMLLQGQMGNAPDTVGGMKLLYNNTAAPLRRLARQFDEQVTEPEINRYYAWLLEYGENDDEKGDFVVSATGSSTLVERDLQEQELGQMAPIVVDTRYGLDPKKWASQWLKSRRFDPENFLFDNEQWQQILEQMAAPPPNPAVDVANIKSELERYRIDSNSQMKALHEEVEVWKKQVDVSESDLDRQLQAVLASAVQESAMANNQADVAKVLQGAKSEISQLLLKLSSQERLAGLKARENQLPIQSQPAEAPGRAPAGESIQK